MSDDDWLSPCDVKQYFFCPRIPFLTRALGVRERETWSMEEGKEKHEELRKKEARRITVALKRKWKGWRKEFGVYLKSEKLRMSGYLDALLTNGSEYVPLEFKDAEKPPGKKPPPNHYYQLVAYALLVEDAYNALVRRGLIYYARTDALIEVSITSDAKQYVRRIAKRIRVSIERGRIPRPSRRKCSNCGYRYYCGGI